MSLHGGSSCDVESSLGEALLSMALVPCNFLCSGCIQIICSFLFLTIDHQHTTFEEHGFHYRLQSRSTL